MLSGMLEAQEYQIHRKIIDNQLFVRWVPTNVDAFLRVVEGDMVLEFYAVGGSVIDPTLQLIERKPLAPLPLADWLADRMGKTEWDSMAVTTVYPRTIDPYYLNNTFDEENILADEQKLNLYRYETSNYVLNYSWSAIENSGFGFTAPLTESADLYALKLYPTANGDTLWIDIDLANYETPQIPELEAIFKNRRVNLKWRTLEFRDDFFAWYLDRSIDGGETWEMIYDLPLINLYDTLTRDSDALKYLYRDDVIPKNDLPVMYRLQGADFMGGRSEREVIVTGEGRGDIRISPLLAKTEQTDSNYAVITWEVRPEEADLIKEFRILETDTTGQNYRVALEGIDPSVRRVVVPMKFRSNFFRVQSVSHVGTELTSFESLVMCYDATPPAVPQEFSGYIDSTGLAHLSWIVSDELDLNGYYLFKGYFEQGELAMITPDPLPGPTHIDSVNMVVGNEWVYYQLRSVDTRGNGSGFTPLLKLKKPDVYPPAPPQFTRVDNDGRQVVLEWTTSPALDVVSYALYRQAVGEESDFGLILTFTQADFLGRYVDTLVQPGLTYRYTLLATDDDGLESQPSKPVSVKLTDYDVREAIEAFTLAVDSDGRIRLDWVYDEVPIQYYLYKATDDEPLSLLKVIDGKARSYLDEGVKKESTYRYLLQALFKNGATSPYTEEQRIRLTE
jgi:hypothetical protein